MPGKGHIVMHAAIEAPVHGLQTGGWAYVEMNFRLTWDGDRRIRSP
jgi:hypothetical protein